MTIHAFIGEKASRTHENLIFREFLDQLAARWGESSDWIYVVANAMWNGAEIDLVVLLPGMVVVADFKSHKGYLTGAENGRWRASGVEVKGGSYANPFVQLRSNKYNVINWLKQHDFLVGQELGHISAMVVFGGAIEDKVDLSSKVRSWFHIIDLDRCAERLDLLASPGLRVSKDQADRIIGALGVEPYRWAPARIHPLGEQGGVKSGLLKLTEGQQDCLNNALSALQSPEVGSIAVTGMTNTGKTLVLQRLAASLDAEGIPYRVLYPNSRLADRAREKDVGHIECNSVYRQLYFNDQASGEDLSGNGPLVRGESAPHKKVSAKAKRNGKHFPLLANNDPPDVVYLVDDAQLIGNGYFETLDGKVFGTGHLVNDLFSYADLVDTRRKFVFFGDPYQLPRMSSEEDLLSGLYQASRQIRHVVFELDQVYDPGNGGARLQNAIRLVDGLRSGRFGSVELLEDKDFRIVPREQAAAEIVDAYRHDPYGIWVLFFQNEQVRRFTTWVRHQLLGAESEQVVAQGELLETIHPFRGVGMLENTSALYRGRRVSVAAMEPVQRLSQLLKGRKEPVAFSLLPEVALEAPGLPSATCRIENLLLDYFERDESPRSADTFIAASVWYRSQRGDRERQVRDAEQESKDDQPEDGLGGIEGISLMQYGYGATVHHAQGMKQPWCFIDGHHQAHAQSAGYFRWLYTALTVAEKGVVLFNYVPIHGFSTMVWKIDAAKPSAAIKVGYGWSINERALTPAEEQRDVPPGLADSTRLSLSVAIWLQIANVVEPLGWKVVSVRSSAYLEKLTLESKSGLVTLSISYDGNKSVTSMRTDEVVHWPLLSKIAEGCLREVEFTSLAKTLLTDLRGRLAKAEWCVVSVRETAWRLHLVIARRVEELIELQMNFDKAGRATSCSVMQHSLAADVQTIRDLLQ